jgi:hypothetical protein
MVMKSKRNTTLFISRECFLAHAIRHELEIEVSVPFLGVTVDVKGLRRVEPVLFTHVDLSRSSIVCMSVFVTFLVSTVGNGRDDDGV